MYRYLLDNTTKPYFYDKSSLDMNIKPIYLFFFLLCFGCKKKVTTLTFEPYAISSESCVTCATLSISIPKALDQTKLSEAINIALREEIITLLNFDEESDAQNIESAVNAFVKDYKNLQGKFPEEAMPWEAKIIGVITFENNEIITIKLDSYLFTGGAHGYSTIRFLNFNKEKGIEMEHQELFKNINDFKTFAEAAFRDQESIPAEALINSTGYMFETENFYLPENIGYTDTGVLLFYEPYAIASYADGPVTLTLPFSEINPFLIFPRKS